MITYTVLFEASGQTDVEADTPDEVLDIIHDHFKGIGANRTMTKIVAINGRSVIQTKGETDGTKH